MGVASVTPLLGDFMGWNGLDLVNDFSAELGDGSTGFKNKVLRWINEGLKDIATSHEWPNLREFGQALLTLGQSIHSIVLAKPAAPTVALKSGGALTTDTLYRVLVTFYEGQSGVESIAGEPSEYITPTGANLSIEVSDIPVSTSPLVTARKLYVSKGSGEFQYHGMINNNLVEIPGSPDPLVDPPTPIVYEITTNSVSQILPPEENAIHKIDGELYIENKRVLQGTSLQNIIYTSNGTTSSGTPEVWVDINQEEVQVYPRPSSNMIVSFFYFKYPARVFGISTSVPDLPSFLRDDLRRYVLWRGYDYRDRAGKESKELTYRENLKVTISRKGKSSKRTGRVRSVTPDSDGMVS